MPLQLGVFGGSFDPPHLGHLIAAQAAFEQLGLDQVLFVPTGSSYHKAAGSDAEHRFEMTRLAISGDERFGISRVDVDRAGPSYTIDTVRDLRAEWPGAELVLIIGEDSLSGFDSWREAERLRTEIDIAVVRRVGQGSPDQADAQLRWVSIEPIGISSTLCRERVRHSQALRYLVPDAVADYIDENKLYRGDERD